MSDVTGQPGVPVQTTPEQQGAAPVVPQDVLSLDKYKGKKSEEIANMHFELEKKLGEQGLEMGSLRREADELRGAVTYLTQQQQAGQQQVQPGGPVAPTVGQPPTQIDWSKPEESIAAFVQNQIQQSTSQPIMELKAQIAASNANAGLSAAKSVRPDLFKENESKVMGVLQEAYRRGALNESSLSSSRLWLTTAAAIDAMAHGFKPSGGGAGTPPVPGELPGGMRQAPGAPNITIVESDSSINTNEMLKSLGTVAGIKDDSDLAKLFERK